MVTSNADWLVMPRLYRERATASKNPALGYNWESRVDLSGVTLVGGARSHVLSFLLRWLSLDGFCGNSG
jgi:hypothetical protein